MGIHPCSLSSSLLQDLSDASPMFDRLGLHEGTSKSVACLQLSRSILKKFEDDSTGSADAAALFKFTQINNLCERYSFPTSLNTWDEEFLGNLQRFLWRFFYPSSDGHILDWPSIFNYAKAGPGASARARGEDFYTKHFDSTLTCTYEGRFLRDVYKRFTRGSEWWSLAEFNRELSYHYTIVDGSSLSFAPKNVDISRTICVEPSLNMFFQLGVAGVLEERLRSFCGVDLSQQPLLNQGLCRQGSLDESFGTIDLASASDSLSMTMLKALLPQEIFLLLYGLRSHRVRIPSGESVELHMLSTMGNGYTFPLQTLLFAGVVVATYETLGISPRKACQGWSRQADGTVRFDNYGVFGDDIIVLSSTYDRICRNLQLLGFSVNSDKSFNKGPFRESCGVDFFRGTDVRGVYCKTLNSVQSRYSLINRLMRWSAKHEVSLPRTMRLLLQSVQYLPVPVMEQDDAGIKVPAAFAGVEGPGPYVYRRWSARPPSLRVGADSIAGPERARKRRFNLYGCAVALVHGSLLNGKIALRPSGRGQVLYVKGRSSAFWWDSLVSSSLELDKSGTYRLKTSKPVFSRAEWLRWNSVVSSTLVQCGR